MAPITTARLATCVVAATLVSAAAATLPTEALADDGPASVPSAPVTAPSLDTGAVLAGEASAAVDDAIGDALGAAARATEQAAPADATSTDAPSAATPVETVRPSETAPVQAPAEPDTTPLSSDTAAGIATTATTAAPAVATAVQASPTNVNVSVRIGSPGDNGPVTQVNVAAAVTSAASATGAGASSAPIVHDGRTEHDLRRTRLDAGIPARRRLFLDRAGRSGDVDLAMELPVEAGSLCDIARGIYDGITSEELDMDLELR